MIEFEIVRAVQYNNITKMKKNRKMTILSELISLADQLAKCNTLPLTFDATYQHPHSYRMIAMFSTKGYPISLRHSSADAVDHLSRHRDSTKFYHFLRYYKLNE